jgi:ammonia channel protein AmtB
MKTIITGFIASLVVASGTVGASAGRELQDAVRAAAVIHPHGIWGAVDQGVQTSGR